MLGIGGTEFAIILVFGFLLFGPDKLPGLGRTLGRGIRQFREAEEGFTKVVRSEIVDPMTQRMSGSEEPAVVDEDDADLEEGDDEAAQAPRESFAECKARMEAERRAAEQEPADVPDEPEEGADSDEDLPEEPEPREEEPRRRSAASLYDLAPAEPAGGEEPAASDDDADDGEGEGA